MVSVPQALDTQVLQRWRRHRPHVMALTTGLAGRGSGQSCSSASGPFAPNPERVLSSQVPTGTSQGLWQPGRNSVASAHVRAFPLPSWRENQPRAQRARMAPANKGEHQER